MKKIFTHSFLAIFAISALLLFTSSSSAQTMGGPDQFGYIWRTSQDSIGPVYNFIDIDSFAEVVDVTHLLNDDNMTPTSYLLQMQPVPFHFYWYDPSTFYIGANGFITFSAGPGISDPFPIIPLGGGQNNYVAAMGADLRFQTTAGFIPGAECKYSYTTNYDSLIIMWKNVPFFDGGVSGYIGSNTFEIILTTVDSSITFEYQAQNGVYLNTINFMTSGIENVSGNIGLQYIYDQYPTPGLAVKYYYPRNSTLQITDAASSYTGNVGSKGIFLSKGGAPYTSKAQVKNNGNTSLNTFKVSSRILNSANGTLVRDTDSTATLAPSQTEDLTFSLPWSHATGGTFKEVTTTLLSGDAVPTNDEDTLEIHVVDTTQSAITLSYDNGINANGLTWTGGQGGAAMHFIPPFYPCNIDSFGCYIVTDANSVGYSMQVYKDDGVLQAPLTKLDSVFMQPGSFIQGQYNQTIATAPIRIDSGGFYVAWLMGGNGITLGEDWTGPFSHRGYEITGNASDATAWTPYRNNEFSDLIIHVVLSAIPVGIDEMNKSVSSIGNFYPNPSSAKTFISYSLKAQAPVSFALYNVNGQLVASKSLGMRDAGNNKIELNLQHYPAGVYNCKITIGENDYNRKIVVVR